MQIELSKEQYQELLKLVHLGSWMVNSYRNTEERIDSVEEVEQYIYSKAKEFESEDLIQFNSQYGDYDVTEKFENQLFQYIDAYDEDTFWAELAERLALRDIARKAGPVQQLTEQQIDRKYEVEERYFREFEKNGLKNILIQIK